MSEHHKNNEDSEIVYVAYVDQEYGDQEEPDEAGHGIEYVLYDEHQDGVDYEQVIAEQNNKDKKVDDINKESGLIQNIKQEPGSTVSSLKGSSEIRTHNGNFEDFIYTIKNEIVHDESEENDPTEMEEEELLVYEELQNVDTDYLLQTESDLVLYNCSSCGTSFESIIDHIQEFHDGQEVVVDLPENGNADNDGDADYAANQMERAEYLEDGEEREVIESLIEEDGTINMKVTHKQNQYKMPQILNTLREEECVDKDGRLYTRKVVQIEKFWDSNKPANEKKKRIRGHNQARVPVVHQLITSEEGVDDPASTIKVEIGEIESPLNIFSCSNCLQEFNSMVEFKVHMCIKKGTYKCVRCDACYRNHKSLCAHMKVHKSVTKNEQPIERSGGPFICHVCNTTFPSNKSLRLHRRMHSPVKPKHIESFYGPGGPEVDEHAEPTNNGKVEPRTQFQCPECNKWYDEAFQTIHMTVHSGEVQHNCQICNRKFFTKSNLEMHMRVHQTEKPVANLNQKGVLPYVCGFCGRQFARPHEKVKHERIHTGEKPHECEICGKRFRVSYCLTLHMRTHTGTRPYECHHCGKRFKAHSVYNHHLMTHSDVRAYKCPYCPKAFKTAVQLAGHKNSHTKPFSCTECNRPFASLYAVRAHMEIHKKVNSLKYKCFICGACYARGFALRDHLKEQHNMTEANELGEHILPDEVVIEIQNETGEAESIEDPMEIEQEVDSEFLENDVDDHIEDGHDDKHHIEHDGVSEYNIANDGYSEHHMELEVVTSQLGESVLEVEV